MDNSEAARKRKQVYVGNLAVGKVSIQNLTEHLNLLFSCLPAFEVKYPDLKVFLFGEGYMFATVSSRFAWHSCINCITQKYVHTYTGRRSRSVDPNVQLPNVRLRRVRLRGARLYRSGV